MQMTTTAHKTVELREVLCPSCGLPASGQTELGGPCINCRQVPRVKKTGEMLSKAEALPGKIATYAVLIIGIIAVVIAIYLGGGERPPVN